MWVCWLVNNVVQRYDDGSAVYELIGGFFLLL